VHNTAAKFSERKNRKSKKISVKLRADEMAAHNKCK
jgi:hypothetical protein